MIIAREKSIDEYDKKRKCTSHVWTNAIDTSLSRWISHLYHFFFNFDKITLRIAANAV